MDQKQFEQHEQIPIAEVQPVANADNPAQQINKLTSHLNVKVNGEVFTKIPDDLYIPPDALAVFLETFEGPLDLLLYLIRKQNIDILDIPIAEITRQYMEYIDLMKDLQLELAGEYLAMAAMLAEIKSRMLLPKPVDEDGEEIDPRAELIRRLQEYERFKKAAEELNALPLLGRDTFLTNVKIPELPRDETSIPDVELKELVLAFKNVLKRAQFMDSHLLTREPLSVRERMIRILERVQNASFINFVDCFDIQEGRPGVVVSFIAILELFRERTIEVVQPKAFGQLYLRLKDSSV